MSAWRGESDFQTFWHSLHKDSGEIKMPKLARDFFAELSNKTKGYFIDFGTNKSYTDFIKLFLNDPILFVDTNLDTKPLSNFINVPPTVNKLRIGIYREDLETKVSLINPDGNELIENSDYNFWELDKIIFLTKLFVCI